MDPTMLSTESADAALKAQSAAQVKTDADMSDMRLSLSMLTSASAEMAAALEKRTLEYNALSLRMGDLSHQVQALKDELHVAANEGAAAKEQLGVRNGQVVELQQKIIDLQNQLQTVTESRAYLEGQVNSLKAGIADLQAANEGQAAENEALQTQINDIQTLLSGAQAARSAVDEELAAAQTSQTALETRLAGVREQLQALVPDMAAEVIPASAPLEGEPEATEAEAAPAAGDPLDLALAAVASRAQMANELSAQVEGLNAQVADLQAQLEAALAAKAEAEARLADAESELAELDSQFDAVQAQLAVALPASAEAEPTEAVEGEPAEAVEVEAPMVSRGAKMGALLAGVSTVVSNQQQGQTELADLKSQLEQTQAQLAAVQAEYDATLATKEELATVLHDRDEEMAGLRTNVDVLTAQVVASAPMVEAAALATTLDDLPAYKRGAATAAVIAGTQPTLSGRLQGLTEVKGIGSVFQQRLYRNGIGTFWELANLKDEDMRASLHLSESQSNRFDFGAIRADAYRLAQETDTVGLIWQGAKVDDFEPLPGLGKVFEQRLYEAGICTYEDLIAAGQERLAEIVQAPEMSTPDFGAWAELARKLIEERQAEPSV